MSLLVPHCHPIAAEGGWEQGDPPRGLATGGTAAGRRPDLGQRLAVLHAPATQQLHHVLGALSHSSLNAQPVPQLLRQQFRTWEEGSALRPTAGPALPCPSPLRKASPGSGDPLASKLLIFIRSRATFSWLSRSIC